MNLNHKKVLVVGTGISGIGAAKLLKEVGAEVILYDSNEKLKKDDIRHRLAEKISDADTVDIVLGTLPETVIKQCDLAVISPGVPADADFVNEIRAHGVDVWGEIELAYRYSKGQTGGHYGNQRQDYDNNACRRNF